MSSSSGDGTLTSEAGLLDHDALMAYALGDQIGTAICATCGGVMFAISVVFILFSTPRSRRQTLFWIQTTTLVLAIAGSYVELASYSLDVRQEIQASSTYMDLQLAKEYFKWLTPWLADIALVFRLAVFYPTTLYSFRDRAQVLGFPILIKVPRLICVMLNLGYMTRAIETDQNNWLFVLKFQLAELCLQMSDGVYVSCFLLLKSFQFARSTARIAPFSNRTQRRARLIIESVFMTFLPPLCLQIVLIVMYVIVYLSNDPTTLNAASTSIFTFHVFLNVIMSLLATSWSSICNTAVLHRITTRSLGDRTRRKAAVKRKSPPVIHSQLDEQIDQQEPQNSHSPSAGSDSTKESGRSETNGALAVDEEKESPPFDGQSCAFETAEEGLAIGTLTQLLQHDVDPFAESDDWTVLRYLTHSDPLPRASAERTHYIVDKQRTIEQSSTVIDPTSLQRRRPPSNDLEANGESE